MDKALQQLIDTYSADERLLNSIVVTSFVRTNGLPSPSGLLGEYMTDALPAACSEVETLEDVIKIFELAIPQAERVTNGAVYTPRYIRERIVSDTFRAIAPAKRPTHCLCADISCGCGAFLYTLAEHIHEQAPDMTYVDIYRHLYGTDISASSIRRASLLLAMLALLHGEDIDSSMLHLTVANSLNFNFRTMQGVEANGGFDIIVGNPPYVRARNLDPQTKVLMNRWETSRTGNADLYIPFFEIGLNALNNGGKLGYITVNTFFKAVNARALRTYLSRHQHALTIVNFGQELVFEKKLAYTALVFIDKAVRDGVRYAKATPQEVMQSRPLTYNHLAYTALDTHRGWLLNDAAVLSNISRIEQAGPSLGDTFTIKNGIATLANDIFIFTPQGENETYFRLLNGGKEYWVEKAICKDIIKPNTLHSEEELETKKEKIIYPYDSRADIYTEAYFRETFPQAYAYLSDCRDRLDKRDKGEGDYPEWYAFGRTQAITDHGTRLLFPYMSDKPHFVLSMQDDLLMYCGYAIFLDDKRELAVLKRVLESSVFDYYIRNTSKPYSTNYFSYAKNYVKNFGLYPFTPQEKDYLLRLDSQEAINSFVASRYGVTNGIASTMTSSFG